MAEEDKYCIPIKVVDLVNDKVASLREYFDQSHHNLIQRYEFSEQNKINDKIILDERLKRMNGLQSIMDKRDSMYVTKEVFELYKTTVFELHNSMNKRIDYGNSLYIKILVVFIGILGAVVIDILRSK